MKKIFTLLILSLFWAGSSWGQLSVIIGTGTSTTNGSSADPIERYYNYEHFQIVYTAAELTAAGMPSGALITALGFSVSESAVSLANFTISMGLTSQALANPYIPVAGLTTVKPAFTYTPVVQTAGNFDMIPFTTNFTWNGTSNIVVNTCTGSNPFTSPYGGLRYTAGTSGIVRYSRADNTSNCGTTTGTNGTNRPNIKFNYTGSTPCSGTPAPGNTLSSANPACAGVSLTLSLQYATTGTGLTYQWQTSATGAEPWAPVGTSSSSFTTSQVAATYYRCQVTCSGSTGTSTPVLVTMNPFMNCYCSSGATNAGDEEIYSVTINGATNAYDCFTVAPGPGSILNRYSNFFPLGPLTSINPGGVVNFSIAENECDGAAFYTNGCAIWIDYNQDGDFDDADEKVFVETSVTTGPRTIAGSFTVPGGAAVGQTAMRITVAEGLMGTGLTPCLAYGYGETEDYIVSIEVATNPMLTVVPGSLNFGSVLNGNTSAEMSYLLSGSNFKPADGDLTITPPPNFEVSKNLGGPYIAAPITLGYSGGKLAGTPIYVVFKPTAANAAYSGSIVNEGGGADPANVLVSGTSPCDALLVPFTEDFSSATFPPVCWSSAIVSGTYNWARSTTSGYGLGTGSAYANFYNATAGSTFDLVTIGFNIATPQLKFDHAYATYATEVDQLKILYSTNGGASYSELVVLNGGPTGPLNTYGGTGLTTSSFVPTATQWASKTYDLPAGTNKIKFQAVSAFGNNLYLDNINVGIKPPVGILSGTVTDAGSAPIAGATVSIGSLTATTSALGFYEIPDVTVGTYDVSCSKTGYQTATIPGVEINIGATTTQNFSLTYQLDPPVDPQAAIQNQYDVHLTWYTPGFDHWIKWDDGANSSSVGLTGGGTFSVASRWAVSDISPYNGMYFRKIRFYCNDATATFTLKVWKGASAATVLHSQLVTPVLGWNEFTLSTPILIDGTDEFWFGYETTHLTGLFPAGCENSQSRFANIFPILRNWKRV